MERKRIVSGIRTTGSLHIGHYLGVLKNWVELQKEYRCFYFAADWHALTSEYRDPSVIRKSTKDMVTTWLSVGIDPSQSVIFRQSDVKNHAELFLLLSMITPLSWLERNPTYKEMREELREKDLSTFGFLGYPVLQAADIVLYHADKVPIGEDQLPHLELTREIARRFNFIYGEGILKEPKEILTEAARVLGIDGRKMSKSYNNAIFVYETRESLEQKVMNMLTDVKRMRKRDPGEPMDCNLYPLQEYFTSEETRAEIQAGCRSASLGCVECKQILLANLIREFEPVWEKIDYYGEHAGIIDEVLEEGAKRAIEESDRTMEKVRSAMKMAD